MNTKDFLDLITPRAGFRVLALEEETADGTDTWLKFRKYDNNSEAAKAAERFDEAGKTVYFGVNSFKDRYYDEKKQKWRIRTQENVASCRSLFDDFDVSTTKKGVYTTREAALADILRLAQAVRLVPTITSSGGGYHAYITLEDDVTPDVWEDLSAMKRDITHHMKLKVDRAVDMDIGRVLRPIGAHNRKDPDNPREVVLVKLGKQYPVEKVREAFVTYIRDNNVAPAPAAKKKGAATNVFGAALENDYPPSDAELVADRCAAIREFRDTKGNISEPHWHRAIGVVKFCEDGERYIHEWSSGHPQYDTVETQQKIDEWEVGPTTCAQMDQHVGCMETCPFKDKCTSPITLGYTDEAPSKAEDTVAKSQDEDETASATTIEGQVIPYWPKSGYRWNGVHLAKARTDDGGVLHWVPFSRSFAYPINRIRDSEGEWQIQWRAREKNGDWREFFMPTSQLAATDQMHRTFSTHEVFLTRTRNARSDMAEFAEDLIEKLQAWRMETKTYRQFGWAENYTKFIMGTTAITATGEEKVLCDPTVPPDVAVDFEVSGSLEEWVANIDQLYNRPGAEPFQFALCHAMGSVLVELFGSSNWHGLPMAFTGHGGTGKSTATKIACGFYGNPKLMERQAAEQGATLNAVIKRIAIMGGLPMVLDEFSGRTPEELTRTGYALANGRDKERLGSRGGFATVGGEWFKNSFITSNDSIVENSSRLPAGYKVEATQLRFFEVSLPRNYRTKIFPDITQTFVEHHMDNVYGVACRPFIQFIIKNMPWVRRQIVAARDKFNPKSEDDNKERFYRDTIVTALVAGKIAEKLGLIHFDVSAMRRWAVNHVINMRESRKELNIDIAEHLARFFATLPGRLIVTSHFGKTNARQTPLEPLRADPVGRVCIEDEKFFIAASAMADFCRDRGIPPSELREELEVNGYIIPYGTTLHRRMNIATGTTLAGSQARCYELDYSKVFDGKNLSVVANTPTAKAKGGSV